jgi:hypothetical protein
MSLLLVVESKKNNLLLWNLKLTLFHAHFLNFVSWRSSIDQLRSQEWGSFFVTEFFFGYYSWEGCKENGYGRGRMEMKFVCKVCYHDKGFFLKGFTVVFDKKIKKMFFSKKKKVKKNIFIFFLVKNSSKSFDKKNPYRGNIPCVVYERVLTRKSFW